jgi:hypothetical protein
MRIENWQFGESKNGKPLTGSKKSDSLENLGKKIAIDKERKDISNFF